MRPGGAEIAPLTSIQSGIGNHIASFESKLAATEDKILNQLLALSSFMSYVPFSYPKM